MIDDSMPVQMIQCPLEGQLCNLVILSVYNIYQGLEQETLKDNIV